MTKKILFIRSENAFLPEIDAYVNYFNKGEIFKAFDSSKLAGNYNIDNFDIIWEMKGIGGIATTKLLVHDYASLSTGKFPVLKNKLKKIINKKPDLRIFLNEDVEKGFSFNDGIIYCFRDMGIDESFFEVNTKEKKYDFIYVGSISKEREIDKLLRNFESNENGTICLVGNVEREIYNKYKDNVNVTFTGKVSYNEVAKLASLATYGINYIPDKYPYNIQTSTKILEYLALDLKIVTTDYKWVRNFENIHTSNFYKMQKDKPIINLRDIRKFDFINNYDAKEYIWEKIIKKSGIEETLLELLKDR